MHVLAFSDPDASYLFLLALSKLQHDDKFSNSASVNTKHAISALKKWCEDSSHKNEVVAKFIKS